jgi:hypothetical protein
MKQFLPDVIFKLPLIGTVFQVKLDEPENSGFSQLSFCLLSSSVLPCFLKIALASLVKLSYQTCPKFTGYS